MEGIWLDILLEHENNNDLRKRIIHIINAWDKGHSIYIYGKYDVVRKAEALRRKGKITDLLAWQIREVFEIREIIDNATVIEESKYNKDIPERISERSIELTKEELLMMYHRLIFLIFAIEEQMEKRLARRIGWNYDLECDLVRRW